jgi:hypothetical protein
MNTAVIGKITDDIGAQIALFAKLLSARGKGQQPVVCVNVQGHIRHCCR